MALNNNQVASVLNDAFKMVTGETGIVAEDLSNIVDVGNTSDILKEKETFTEALCAVLVKRWFTDSSYRSQYSDPFFEDAERFGAIMEAISIKVPEVQYSHAWKDFKPVSGQPATAGVYELFLPVINSKYYGKSISWELPVAITDEQWDPSCWNEAGVREIVTYILLCVDNALVVHLENMNNMNRNNFIAEKVHYASSQGATGIHVINLVEEYQKSKPTPASMTADQYLDSDEGMRFSSECMKNYMGFMGKMNKLFNTEGEAHFVPKDRLVVQILECFENRMNRVALSNVFHDEYVKLPLHETIPYWQGIGDGATGSLTFDDLSTINVKTGSGEDITISGVVGFMCDKWAIMHTVKNHRTTSVVFKPEAVTQYYNQFRDQYMNNLALNALVFTVKDFTV